MKNITNSSANTNTNVNGVNGIPNHISIFTNYNTISNSPLIIDSVGNVSGINSLLLNKLGSNPVTDSVWVNTSNNHLYHGNTDLEAVGAGDVIGPASSTDNAVAIFDSTTGKLLKNSTLKFTNSALQIPANCDLAFWDGYSDRSFLTVSSTYTSNVMAGFYSNKGAGSENVGLGNYCYGSGIFSGSANTAIGHGALNAVTTGSNNTCIGDIAGGTITTGYSNVAIGVGALQFLVDGAGNIAIGEDSGGGLTSGLSNIYLGNDGADIVITEDNTMRLGRNDTTRTFIYGINGVTSGNKKIVTIDSVTNQLGAQTDNYIVGPNVATLTAIPIFDNTSGKSVANSSVGIDGIGSISILGNGTYKMSKGGTIYTVIDTNQYGNLAVGYNAGLSTSTSATAGNSSFGDQAGQAMTSGIRNTNIGYQTGKALTTGQWNTNLGYAALKTNISGQQNTALGYSSLTLNTGSYNTAIGSSSLSAATGDSNIAIGYQAGQVLTSGSNNIFIAHQGVNADSGTIRIGTATNQTSCFIAGISDTTISSNKKMVTIDSVTNQLGVEFPMVHATAETYFENYVTNYTRSVAVIGTFYEIQSTNTLLSNNDIYWDASVSGRLKWLGANGVLTSSYFHGAFSFCCALASGVNDSIEVYVAVDGVKVPGSAIRRKLSSTSEYNMITFHKAILMAPNSYVSCFVANLTDTDGISFVNCNMLMMKA